MRPVLQLKPLQNSFIKILIAFNNGTPLTSDQVNFLRRYHSKFSNTQIDSVCKYYNVIGTSAPNPTIRAMDRGHALISPAALKDEVTQALKKASTYQVRLSLRQMLQFKVLLMNELIFLHGNHTLTGAPFLAGGVPHVELFQWGNLFGIVKYEEILGETALDANVLIYFEEKQDQTLAQIMRKQRLLHLSPHIIQPHLMREPITNLQKEELHLPLSVANKSR